MNLTTQKALVGTILGICIILIVGTGIHIIQTAYYMDCMTTITSVVINTTYSECVKPGWWFGL
jgi:hypothetical protein